MPKLNQKLQRTGTSRAAELILEKVFQEVKRVAAPGAFFICSVPVPERNKLQNTIRGTLYSEKELEDICQKNGIIFECIPVENGALLYFKAISQ